MAVEEVLREAAGLVTPPRELEDKVRRISEQFREYVGGLLSRLGVEGSVELVGSSARGTWLPDGIDVDVFVVLPRKYPKGFLDELVGRLRAEMEKDGVSVETRYAEHPYLVAHSEGVEVDVVPCFEMRPGEPVLTAADRSPLHHKYLLSRLDDKLKLDVRLLKRFMKTVGVYGAEVKVEGFSGYLTELLVAHYGSFLSVLEAAARWRPYKTVVDPEGYYQDPRKAVRKFRSPLVVVDPVDPNRNVAAAVSTTSMATFVLAARRFLQRPSISYFSPQAAGEALPVPAVVLRFSYPQKPPDVVWGMFKRYARALANKLDECGFKVLRFGVDSDERTFVDVAFLVESTALPEYELHEGPPVFSEAADKFVEKYAGSDVVGPFVAESRIYVIRRRKIREIGECLDKALKELGLRPQEIKKGTYPPLSSKNPWIS
ncbi:MAG: CCA tRNA nucleotidyltransferase [Thermoproteus sp.]